MMQITQQTAKTTGATTMEALPENNSRVALYITNTGGNTITIVKGRQSIAVAGQGIILQANGTWFETDSEGFRCWKGAVQVIGAGASTIAISETSEVA